MARHELIATLILERPLCVDCIVDKSQRTVEQVEVALAEIAAIVQLAIGLAGCRQCGRVTTTYCLGSTCDPFGD